MEPDAAELVRDIDRQAYRDFLHSLLPRVGRPVPETLWHYTDAGGLIGILESGQLYATHIACLNDLLEHRYLTDLVYAEVRKRLPIAPSHLKPLYSVAEEYLSKRDTSTESGFAACFSEVADDLGQWRGYGGGECSFAIGFSGPELLEVLPTRPGTMLLPMNYQADVHAGLVDYILGQGELFYTRGLQRTGASPDVWAPQFLLEYSNELALLAALVKHPKFESEKERRIFTTLSEGEHSSLEFRPRRTLLARYLKISLTQEDDEHQRMPITHITIGPGPAQQVNKIAVGDALKRWNYEGVTVEMSDVPYRIP